MRHRIGRAGEKAELQALCDGGCHRGATGRLACGGQPFRSSSISPRSWTASAARRFSPRCLTAPDNCSTAPWSATLAEVAAAVRLLAERNRVIAEGAGACPVACALSGQAGAGKIVCVVSGGNIDATKLCAILCGGSP